MIPRDFITEWRSFVGWESSDQVEQDLIISRALVEIYRLPFLTQKLAFRGGTALHKVHLSKQYRYSEDLDFIQIEQEPIGETFDALRSVLDPWLGTPKRELKEGLVKLQYRIVSEEGNPLRLKVEINSREHFAAKSLIKIPFVVKSRWFNGGTDVTSLSLPWLMGSKLRALYQRKKGRDLFDIMLVLDEGKVTSDEIVSSFLQHIQHSGLKISRAEFEENLSEKKESQIFNSDLLKLISGDTNFDMKEAFNKLMNEIAPLFPGEPWKGPEMPKKQRPSKER
jgi:predicted nucleotidyltransferase component of viral defense system